MLVIFWIGWPATLQKISEMSIIRGPCGKRYLPEEKTNEDQL